MRSGALGCRRCTAYTGTGLTGKRRKVSITISASPAHTISAQADRLPGSRQDPIRAPHHDVRLCRPDQGLLPRGFGRHRIPKLIGALHHDDAPGHQVPHRRSAGRQAGEHFRHPDRRLPIGQLASALQAAEASMPRHTHDAAGIGKARQSARPQRKCSVADEHFVASGGHVRPAASRASHRWRSGHRAAGR